MKYVDGVIKGKRTGSSSETRTGYPPTHSHGIPEPFIRKVIEETGDKYKVLPLE